MLVFDMSQYIRFPKYVHHIIEHNIDSVAFHLDNQHILLNEFKVF